MKSKPIILIVSSVLVVALVGCANLQTVSRKTSIPQLTYAPESNKPESVAIHLDAQQRLVIFSEEGYCAEPSPDALSAYVAALGLGSSNSSGSSISLSELLQSGAGSIGLRTQSITLMRDALYRMCEAANNDHLNKVEVAAFLRRSQDLTAVVLAIEQLTGAVTANQVILSPGSNAQTTNLLSNQQFLDLANQDVQKKRESVTTAESHLAGAIAERDRAAAGQDGKAPQAAEEKVTNATVDLEQSKQQLQNSVGVRDAIKASHDTALTNAATATESSGGFSTPIQRNQLSTEATKAIADAVTSMVSMVIDNNEIIDICMSYLTSLNYEYMTQEEVDNDQVAPLCRDIVLHSLQKTLDEYKL